jgi:hypothetical protein
MKTYAVLTVAGALCTCGSRTALWDGDAVGASDLLPDGAEVPNDDTSLFVGTWTCMDTATGYDPGHETLPVSSTETVTFVPASGGSLEMTIGVASGGPICSLNFSISGSTARVIGEQQTCFGEDSGPGYSLIRFLSGSFAVSGKSATIDLNEAVPAVPGGDAYTATLAGTCTWYSADGGSP